MKEYISKSEVETKKIAREFAQSLNISPEGRHQRGAMVIGLYGELGAGKTTFMKYLSEYLGVKETVQSPTFAIMKIYNLEFSIFKKLIHIDAYRIDDPKEMLTLGWEEIIRNPENLIFIEWPERLEAILHAHIMVRFEHVSNTKVQSERKISFA